MSTPMNTSGARVSSSKAESLIRIGEEAIAKDNPAALETFFAVDEFVFHTPELAEINFRQLADLFAAMRHAFSDFTVTREHILVDGDFVSAQTTMAGVFTNELTASPIGTLPPTGRPISLRIHNLFRYNADGLLAEEWVQYDNREWLRQFGAAEGSAGDAASNA